MGVCGRPILESGEEAVGRGLALRAGREDVEGAGKGGGNPCLPACLPLVGWGLLVLLGKDYDRKTLEH